MGTFRVSNAAVADLESIGRYTQKQWGKVQRRAYLDGLNDQFKVLSLNPALAVERHDFNPPVRISTYEKHLIIYIIDDQGVFIIRVLHQNMNVPTHLFPDSFS